MNTHGERKRSLLCRCFDVISAEPDPVKRDLMRELIEPWRRAIYEAQDESLEYTEKEALAHLQRFLRKYE